MRIGIDWGGTKIEAIAIDDAGVERLRRRIPTPRHDYAASIEQTVALVAQFERELGERAKVGIGIPGTIDAATGLVKNANSTWLIGKPFQRDLEAALERSVRCANDANCLALSEASDGAGANVRVVFAAILGTGCGGGIAIDARVHEGAHGVAGEWGHNPLPWPREGEVGGPRCYCGRDGCIETWLSGPSFERDYARPGDEGEALRAPAIAARAAAGEPRALAALERYEDRLARALAHVVNLLDPGIVVLGGGMSNVERLYERVPQLLPRYVFGGGAPTPIVPAAHGDSSGVRGAAWLWPPN